MRHYSLRYENRRSGSARAHRLPTQRAACCASRASARSSSTRWRSASCAGADRDRRRDRRARRAHPLRLRARLAHGRRRMRDAVPVGERARVAASPAAGCTRCRGWCASSRCTHAPGEPEPFAEAIWHESYEAEQHLLHFGRAEEPVCWTLIGFASGYLSFCNGKEIICIEERCVGQGDAACHMIGKPREEWGDASRRASSATSSKQCLDAGLAKVTDAAQADRAAAARQEEAARARTPTRVDEPAGMVARSAEMQKVLELARRVAHVDSTVLDHRRERRRQGARGAAASTTSRRARRGRSWPSTARR